jgi:N-alpha-acetyltransferase 15/16, NatA auxiliary subunit
VPPHSSTSSPSPPAESDPSPQNPATLFWVHLFLAAHFDKCGRRDDAAAALADAVAHTPTIVETRLVEAKLRQVGGWGGHCVGVVLLSTSFFLVCSFFGFVDPPSPPQHVGDWNGAADAAEAARRMDLADRYLNTRAVKCLLRAGRIEEAGELRDLSNLTPPFHGRQNPLSLFSQGYPP